MSQQLISLQASDEPLGRIAERQTGDGAPVLAVSSGECATARLGSSIENSKPNVKHFSPKTLCESGSQRLENPAPKQLK
jgi:hypothetical protein